MPGRAVSVFALATFSGMISTALSSTSSASSSSPPCVPLFGIESGGNTADGLLDSDAYNGTFAFRAVSAFASPCSEGLETPISMRNLLGVDLSILSLMSMFTPTSTALDIFGDKETSDARRRCQPAVGEGTSLIDTHVTAGIVYAYVYAGVKTMPYCLDVFEPLMESAGYPLSLVLEGDPDVNTPWGLAKAYVDEVFAFMDENDGWNADGSLSREFNRVPFSDFAITDSAGNSWTPYTPKNTPYKFSHKKRWQPLMESDGLGYISVQEHVTPHIGFTARFFGFNSTQDEEAYASRQLDPPRYKYRAVADQVIEETRLTANDTFKQAAVDFFDNKQISLLVLKAVFFARSDPRYAVEYDFYALTAAVQLNVYNGVIMAWREKIRHDLPRPPTIVKEKLGDTVVETYAGPGEGVQSIKASEWEPLIRTMPHSEFPSASSCICEAFIDQVLEYVGVDTIDPPLEFGIYSFASWSDISLMCGESRLWGGLHFEDAVPAGAELCGGTEMPKSVWASITRLRDGDAAGAVFKRDVGELMVRPL